MRGNNREFGLCETWEENERDERENAREDMEVAIFELYPERRKFLRAIEIAVDAEEGVRGDNVRVN